MATTSLLEREDPSTPYASDARHWIAIYRERIELYRDLLERARGLPVTRSRRGPDAGAAAQDAWALEESLHDCEQRLEFWYARQWTLEGLELDRECRRVGFRGRWVQLTGREFQLLDTLAHRNGGFMRPQQLLVEAWRDSRLPEETLRTYIVRLRAKLAELGVGAQIVNRPRHGYALVFAART